MKIKNRAIRIILNILIAIIIIAVNAFHTVITDFIRIEVTTVTFTAFNTITVI